MVYLCEKSLSRKKSCTSYFEISVTWTAQECDVTMLSSFRSIICQVIAYGRLKTKENFNLLGRLREVAAYKRFKI